MRGWCLGTAVGAAAFATAYVVWARPAGALAIVVLCQVPILVALGCLAMNVRRANERLSDLAQRVVSGEQARDAADLALREALADVARQGEEDVQALGDRVIRALGKSIVTTNRKTFRQLEALTNLNSIFPFDRPMPATRGWAASPDLLLLLVDLVRQSRSRLIVECGSGTSTLWFARALYHYGIDGRVVALEHEKKYAERTRRILEDHELARLVDVRDASLEMFEIGAIAWRWYAASAWNDLRDIDVLFVDGPPARTAPKARFPALPLLADRLAPRAIVVVDDVSRSDEHDMVQDWAARYPEFSVEKVQLEAGGAILRRDDSGLTPSVDEESGRPD
jgi:predicted O-methyltransferase YrrM